MPFLGTRLSPSALSPSLILSYALDWIVLVAVVVVAAIVGRLGPKKRPFSLEDPDISFPFTEHETVPLYLLLILCVAIPVAVIPMACLVLVPGPTTHGHNSKALLWRRKAWELHVGWLGLALALVSAWFFTETMKNMFGKPRPDLLARCEPDTANAKNYIVGSFGSEIGVSHLYSADICQQADSSKLNEGFRSFPSGHSSASAAGLIYLSLFLASKLSVAFPFTTATNTASPLGHLHSRSAMAEDMNGLPSSRRVPTAYSNNGSNEPIYASPEDHALDKFHLNRRHAAAPPVYLLVVSLLPFCLAIFISSSRWFDFRHHGFDILFGFIMGTITAIFSFHYYQMPLKNGMGWAWGARSPSRAFWSGVGVMGYVSDSEGVWRENNPDIELRQTVNQDHA